MRAAGLARIGLMGGDTRAAEQQLNKALESARDDIQTWIFKGELELSLGKPETCASLLRQGACELSPTSAAARMGVVRAMLAQGKSRRGEPSISTSSAKGRPPSPAR